MTFAANGASNAGKNPPVCCNFRRFCFTLTFLHAIRRNLDLYFRRRVFSSGVICTFPCRMLCAHSHSACMSSGSACSSIAFRSFAFLVLINTWRNRACFFIRPDMFSITTDWHSPLIVYSHLSTQLWYVDKLMRIVRQYGRTQAQVVGCVLFQIDQKIAVRRGCRIGECLLNERASPGVHLFGQVGDLRRISRVLENHHVLRV